MKKLFLITMTVVMLVAFVSCNEQFIGYFDQPDTLVGVVFRPVINQKKSITGSLADGALDPHTYQYKASPVSKNSMMRGTSADWQTLEKKSGSVNEYETSQSFSVGQWNFEIRALNEDGGLIYQGESEAVLTANEQTNVVSVGLFEKINSSTSEKGTVSINISTPHLITGVESGNLVLEFKTMDGSTVSPTVKTALSSTESNGVLTYSGAYQIEPGFYLVKASYSETLNDKTASMSSSVVALRVIEKTTSEISGNIEESLFVSAQVNIGAAKKVSGSLSYSEADDVYTCTFTPASGDDYLTPTAYYWYEDGLTADEETTSTTHNYTPGTAYGLHSITCVAVYEDESTGAVSVFSATTQITV